jgi:hypothetical protein
VYSSADRPRNALESYLKERKDDSSYVFPSQRIFILPWPRHGLATILFILFDFFKEVLGIMEIASFDRSFTARHHQFRSSAAAAEQA